MMSSEETEWGTCEGMAEPHRDHEHSFEFIGNPCHNWYALYRRAHVCSEWEMRYRLAPGTRGYKDPATGWQPLYIYISCCVDCGAAKS